MGGELGRIGAGPFFFFQAEDGIRDHCVTGVQTCALPIWSRSSCRGPTRPDGRGSRSPSSCSRRTAAGPTATPASPRTRRSAEIGRASCRERVQMTGAVAYYKKKTKLPTDHGAQSLLELSL